MGKGETAHNEQFLLFSQRFPSFHRPFYHFHQLWNGRLHPFWKLSTIFINFEMVDSILSENFLPFSSTLKWSTPSFLKTFYHFHQLWNGRLHPFWKLSTIFINFEMVDSILSENFLPFSSTLKWSTPSFLKTFYHFHQLWNGRLHPFWKLSTIFIKFEIVDCKLFQFWRV